MLHLDPINKVLVMAGAAAAVALTILAVVCFVGEGCLVYELRGGKTKREYIREHFYGLRGSVCV